MGNQMDKKRETEMGTGCIQGLTVNRYMCRIMLGGSGGFSKYVNDRDNCDYDMAYRGY